MRKIAGWLLIAAGALGLLVCGVLGLWMAQMFTVGMNASLRALLTLVTLASPIAIYSGYRMVR